MLDLEPLITKIVDERIAIALGGHRPARTWTSQDLPPDCPSRRAFATACKAIPGAKRLGKCWVVAREAWDAHRSKPRRSANDIDELIAAAGFRPTKAVAR